MKYEVLNGDVVIGESNLETYDYATHVRSGRFRPLAPYFALQPIFRDLSTAIEHEHGPNRATAIAAAAHTRSTLALSVRERRAARVPSSAIHIADLEGFPDDLEITVFPAAN